MKSINEFKCPICDTVGKWENIDHVRLKKSDMHICNECGFVTYPTKYQSYEEIKEYYKKNYRPGPQAANLFTGERKLQYHAFFLTPLFEEWKKAGIEKPDIGEVGAAYGMVLNWIKTNFFPEANIHGTELTETFKRVAFHEYGIKLEDDFDDSRKYDLIISYHVLEHQIEPDKWLARYGACLKDSGLMYLSCPIWFREAANGAAGGFDIEYHWATDHINCWSDEHIDYLIQKAGLEIVMKDTEVYGNTYILKRSTKTVMKPKFDKNKYKEIAENIFKCWQLIQENKSDMAIEAYKNCPAAWINHYEMNRKQFHDDKKSRKEFLDAALEACPNSSDIANYYADILTRYEEYDEAIKMFGLALKRKPNNPTFLMGISNCWRMKAKRTKDEAKKKEYLLKSLNILRFTMTISTEMLPTAISWAYQDEASLPVD